LFEKMASAVTQNIAKSLKAWALILDFIEQMPEIAAIDNKLAATTSKKLLGI